MYLNPIRTLSLRKVGESNLGIFRIHLEPSRALPSGPLVLEFEFWQACQNQRP